MTAGPRRGRPAAGLAAWLSGLRGGPPFLSRPIASYGGMEKALGRALREAGLDALPEGSFLLYGSFLRALWTGERWADVNIAFSTPRAHAEWAPVAAALPRVRCRERPCAARALLGSADFTVCQAVYSAGVVHSSPGWIEHLSERLLVLNRVTPATALATYLRTHKYVARGFVLPPPELATLLRVLRRAPLDMSGLDVEHESGGAVYGRC